MSSDRTDALIGFGIIGAGTWLAYKAAKTVVSSLTGSTTDQINPTAGSKRERHVYLISSEVDFRNYKFSKLLHAHFTSKFGGSLYAVSHWGVVVLDAQTREAVQIDLMSQNMKRPGKNNLRMRTVDAAVESEWLNVVFVGKSTRTDAEIRDIGESMILAAPRYDLLYTQCQGFAEKLLKTLCNTQLIDAPSLHNEIRKVAPAVAMYWATTKFLSDVLLEAGQQVKTDAIYFFNRVEESVL